MRWAPEEQNEFVCPKNGVGQFQEHSPTPLWVAKCCENLTENNDFVIARPISRTSLLQQKYTPYAWLNAMEIKRNTMNL